MVLYSLIKFKNQLRANEAEKSRKFTVSQPQPKIQYICSYIVQNVFCWSSGKAFVFEAVGLRFKVSRRLKLHTVLSTACHRCDIAPKGAMLLADAMMRG